MPVNILYFDEIDASSLSEVGGKGANLGELKKAGFPVPDGFCVTTSAYRSFIDSNKRAAESVELFSRFDIDDLEEIRKIGDRIRLYLLDTSLPEDVRTDVLEAWSRLGEHKAYAVRSSATAEDLPTASFAGQLVTYLNVIGDKALLESIQKCMASLFSEKAISYRIKNGLIHSEIAVSVIVQKMVFPEVSGIMFTADPASGNRKVVSIDAGFGLGEAIVSGLTDADLYKVKSGRIIEKRIAEKKLAVYPLPEGGTWKQALSLKQQHKQVLPDGVILKLSNTGRDVEAHYGTPQDIEWAMEQGILYVVQSRPITTLFPVPDRGDNKNLRIYFSFGHRQNMTDAIKPLGISLLRTLVPYGKKSRENPESMMILPAGSRLYIDLTDLLRFRYGYRIFVAPFKQIDEITANALEKAIKREEFTKNGTIDIGPVLIILKYILFSISGAFLDIWVRDPKKAKAVVERLTGDAVKVVDKNLRTLKGADRIRFIQDGTKGFFKSELNKTIHYAAAGIISQLLIDHYLKKWLGDSSGLRYLNKSLPGNITTEMGLELGDLADIARGNRALIAYLKRADDATFYEGLHRIKDSERFSAALESFMQCYGMRCAGEVDITRARWNEAPSCLMPILLGDVETIAPGEHRLRFEKGESEAKETAQRIIERLKLKRNGFIKAKIMSRLITVFRCLMPLREHPKYLLISQFDLYKQAILDEARAPAGRGVINNIDDIYYLSLTEIVEMIEGRFKGDVSEIVRERRAGYIRDENLVPPRVITSEGEIVSGLQNHGIAPPGSLIGLPVSSGIVEGRARVLFRPEQADLEPGDILVAPHTDPAWTTLFISARGVVTEAGGLMTHGAVIAREYGIPAVAGVDRATDLIKNGQRIRVNGNRGYVEVV